MTNVRTARPLAPIAASAGQRLLRQEVALLGGIADLVKHIVHEVHHQIRVGKGDENVGLSLDRGKRRSADEEQHDAEYKSQSHADSAEDHAEQHTDHTASAAEHRGHAADAQRAGDDATAREHQHAADLHDQHADHHASMAQHHQRASEAYGEAGEKYGRKKWRAGDAAAKIAKRHVEHIALQKSRGARLKKPPKLAAPKAVPQPKPPRAKQARIPKQPKPAAGPQAPAPTSPTAAPSAPASPAPSATRVAHAPSPKAVAQQHAPRPPRVPKPKKSASLRAARPEDQRARDNDTDGAQAKTAHADIAVSGTINGRTMHTTVSAGQTYHLREVDGKTQLVVPGLFGRFFLDPASRGKL